ncbi:hypothetical protein [Calothrix sp. UHCC 0171]|nr:hypothetical protein [Calothrix sp. UHCC 0171]MEA5573817.1 hypothetical protein [Calothrix sp. UHCC 0171]
MVKFDTDREILRRSRSAVHQNSHVDLKRNPIFANTVLFSLKVC